jgi:hypothetical protein
VVGSAGLPQVVETTGLPQVVEATGVPQVVEAAGVPQVVETAKLVIGYSPFAETENPPPRRQCRVSAVPRLWAPLERRRNGKFG